MGWLFEGAVAQGNAPGLLRSSIFDPEGPHDMCESLPQGGQRCYSNTLASLVSAEARYRGILQEWAEAVAEGIARPDNLRARKLKAQYDLFDARVRHASTPQGEADLSARVHQFAHAGHPRLLGTRGRDLAMPDFSVFAEADTEYLECIQAIAEGIGMRERNQDIADVNRDNRLTPQTVAELGRYPNASEQHIRDATIAHAKRQNARLQAPEAVVAA